MTEERKGGYSFREFITIVWFIIDAFTHLSIELGYVFLALTTTAEKTDSLLGHIWREYSRADKRWAIRDPNVISIEIATVFMGFLCLIQLYGLVNRKSWRYALQMVICVSELYGGWMTFAPEWIEGNPNLDGSTFNLLWIYLVFMNGLWVVVPLLLLWDSYSRMSDACASQAPNFQPKSAPSKFWFYLCAGTIVAYMILVPAVLSTAPGVPVKV